MEVTNFDVVTRTTGPNSVLSNLRKEGFVPGVLYGENNFNEVIQVDSRSLMKQLRKHGKSGIFTINVNNESVPVKINEVQKDPIDGSLIHVDLQRVNMDRVVYMSVPIHVFGQAQGVKSGGTIQQQLREVEVKALPSFVPESFHVSIADLEIGDAIYVRDIDVPQEVELLHDEDSVILTVLPPKMSEEEAESKNEEPESEPEIVNARDGQGIDAAK